MRLTTLNLPRCKRGRGRTMGSVAGLSIVELLVGIAIGLFVLAGATMVASTQISDNRLLLLETQIHQDLRTTADLVTREFRRGGYWANAPTMAWPKPGAPAVVNMYPTLSQAAGAGGRPEFNFTYSKATGPGTEDDAVNADEQFGFALNAADATIEARLGGAGWQAMTDPNVVQITQFNVQPNTQVLVVPCAKLCPAGGTACWPRQTVRDLTIAITGQAVHDANVRRSARSGVRLRNDEVAGECPA